MEKRPFNPTEFRLRRSAGPRDGNRERRAKGSRLRESLNLNVARSDTAEMYLSGTAEEGVAIAGRRGRGLPGHPVFPDSAPARGAKACVAVEREP